MESDVSPWRRVHACLIRSDHTRAQRQACRQVERDLPQAPTNYTHSLSARSLPHSLPHSLTHSHHTDHSACTQDTTEYREAALTHLRLGPTARATESVGILRDTRKLA
eukprot:3549666-Prymnesium_polylepis.1